MCCDYKSLIAATLGKDGHVCGAESYLIELAAVSVDASLQCAGKAFAARAFRCATVVAEFGGVNHNNLLG